jgi:thymidylate synthase (FAD)
MKVTLLDYTQDAEDQLIFTKSTRLNMSPGLLDEIRGWPQERKREELRYIANTIKSSWEFVGYTFLIEGVSRAFTHQFVRTRQASYAQQSMRVTDMSRYDFVMPARIEANAEAHELVKALNEQIAAVYATLITKHNIPAEDARSVLPTNIATNIVARYNLRTFADLAASRLGGRTQDEYRTVMALMVDQVLAVHPWAHEFIFGQQDRDYFNEIEEYARRKFPDLKERGELLKLVDKMRAAR